MTWAIFSDAQVRAIGEMLSTESSRTTAIVGGALLDDTLQRTLAERLRDHRNMRDKLLGMNRPMGNAAPKNDLLYMLRAYDRPLWNAIDGIIIIRNFFAHHLDASFDSTDNKFVAAMNKLQLHEYRKYYPHHLYDEDSTSPIEPVINNRVKFVTNLKLCLLALMRDRVSHELWTNRPFTKEELVQQRANTEAVKKKTSVKQQEKEPKRP